MKKLQSTVRYLIYQAAMTMAPVRLNPVAALTRQERKSRLRRQQRDNARAYDLLQGRSRRKYMRLREKDSRRGLDGTMRW